MKLTGAQILWESLIQQGTTVLFGYPGGATLPAYDALVDYTDRIHHVLVRHEENAALAADAYYRATGRVGVCMATSGPGATNLVTGLANAMMDSAAVVAITGQVASQLVGSDAFQETDVTGVTLPITKHNYLVQDVSELAQVLAEAFYIAKSGRPGPVLVDICKDVQQKSTDYTPVTNVQLRGYRAIKPFGKQDTRRLLVEASEMIDHAKKPVILAGQGIKHGQAHEEFKTFVEKSGIPVATTLLGIGVLDEDHPQNLRMMGMHGEAYVNHAIANADLLIALGMRFDDRVTGNLKMYAKHARVIHIDIDAAEIGKNVPADVGIVGNVKDLLPQLTDLIEPKKQERWMEQINEWRADTKDHDVMQYDLPDDMLLAPQVIRAIWEETEGNITVCTDVGQHQMWETQYFQHRKPNQLITSGGLGTMGYSLPAAIGAKFGRPDDEVWAIAGDGGIQMATPEMMTIIQEGLDIKIAVINNHYLGMVRQWQELMHGRRYSSVSMVSPNFVKLAEAYGICGFRATTVKEAREAIRQARAHNGPTLIEFVVEQETNVFPMIQPGKALDEMTRRPVQPAALGGGMEGLK
ncbi:MAG TPA: biosynthetic-type acetolactate synthase large subunit [Thermoflexales bacterium]|mgnify:CR=1 FL=1|nr:biosynthetic-type acetolactate synthase large subunit [Thermoflexales bacterium]HQW35288.1 biosynthetic-type acetolactate synthase large subunit [Thermoflexales bacterium]HQZ21709.1 biosynthetic-type acetolactate synthase large subunit [Thermoflexales bacterium]HQZ98902.1 biosynthetic-type acetolactate synthase large subunit [Thermoflexales bacterium]